MSKTTVYRDYTYDAFVREFAVAFENSQAARVELGTEGATEADLTPEERRQRMWWRKLFANYRENFKTFDLYRALERLPENLDGLGPWVELPPHLR
jgi:hypothetical protein